MKSRFFSSILAAFLIVSLIAPPVFLMAPQTAYAQGVPTDDWLVRIKETLNLISTYTNTAANVAQQVNTYVLQPLAFVMSGNLMKLLTASVLNFVIGRINGTGAPQFVQDLNGNLQRVGDIQANAFFIQFGRNSNSPFAGAITSSLRTNYLWNTSSAGFFAANQSTLGRYSSNPNAFVAGNWSRGGIGAWFALTTQNQNNPYLLYQASQGQLASIVGSAISARLAELNWGQGFLSWCGANDTTTPADAQTQTFDDGSTLTTDSTGNTTSTNAVGINPGDPCLNADGTPGTIKTPGSTIKATLDKVLGGTQDKLAQIGSLAKEVNGILGNIGTVLSTAQFASELLGGPGSGGLFGVGQTSATNPTSRLLQYQAPGYLGVTQSTVLHNAATIPASGSDMSGRLNQYESSWATIRGAANAASTTVASLATFCIAQQSVAPSVLENGLGQSLASFISASNAQAAAARSAITTQIAPILAQADAAAVVIANARAMVARVQSDSNSTAPGAGSTYVTDLQTLQEMPPSDTDIANAMQDAQSFGAVIAIPVGSLTISGGTVVSRMSLISTNAEALKTSVCTPSHVDPSAAGPRQSSDDA